MGSLQAKLTAVVLATALAAAACGSDGGSSTEAAASPLAEFLGQDDFFTDDAESQARRAEEAQAREEKIAACMAEQGFEYIPRANNSDFNFATSPDGLEYGTREYVEKYGFGITTQWFSQEEVGPDLVGNPFQAMFEDEQETDPNQEIVQAMDESTRQAYEEALYGDPDDFPSFDPETMSEEELEAMEDEFSFEPQGCEGEAWSDAFNNDFYRDFQDELEDLYKAVQDDPRIAAQIEEVNSCVADKGFEFDAGFDGYEKLYERFDTDLAKIDEMIGGFPGEDLTEEDFAAMSEEELDALFNQPREFTPEAKTLLGELQAEEIELALVVHDCGGGDDANADLYQEISAEYEQRFIDENADRLSQYKADN